MRIAHVSPYEHHTAGGVRSHVINLAGQHRSMGHDVSILAPADPARGLPPEVVPLVGGIVPVPAARSIARIPLSPRLVPQVGRALREGDYDVLHIHEPLCPIVGIAALHHAEEVPVRVGTIHGYRPQLRALGWLRPVLEPMMQRLSARVAVSVDAERWIGQYFPADYHIVPDGVDVARFADPSIQPIERFDDGRPNVLFVGRMEPRKGFPHLLEIWPEVKRAVPDARLLVTGHFDERRRARLDAEVRDAGAADVELVGFVPDDELPRYYRTAQVFCAPSTGFEALGIVLLEAMASGATVVTTDIVGYRTVVTHREDALVVPPADPPALAAALIEALTDAALREKLSDAGRRRVEHYDWPVIAEQLVGVYESSG